MYVFGSKVGYILFEVITWYAGFVLPVDLYVVLFRVMLTLEYKNSSPFKDNLRLS